jgi:WD40 repeat protein
MKDNHPEQQPSTNDSGSRIRDVVEDWLARQAAGVTQSEASLIADHPDLMPGLGEQLRRLHRIRAAMHEDGDEREVAASLSRPPPSTPGTDGSGDTELHVRCPQCHALVPATGDAPLRTVICPQCESHFSLLGDTPVELYSGRRVGDFELIRPLGSGGFGTVWQARDVRLQRTVALKIPRFRHLAEDELDLFWREARAAAHLRHPHIVPVHEIGREGPTIYLVHDYIEGTNLAEWLVEQSLTARESARLVATVAEALHYAHQSGIVHRDIKPSNILLDGDLQPYVTDFGLAKRDMSEVTLSTTGKIVGTPAYMSPEQAAGSDQEVDRRSDIYSLGVILFELLTGELPFRGAAHSVIQRVIHDEPPHPRQLNSTIPRNLATVCLKAMARLPAHRYATARELADDLHRYLRGEPVRARSPRVWERGWRWARRRPALAGLWVAGCIAVLAIGGASAGLFYSRSLQRSLGETEQQREAAQIAQRGAEQFQYLRHMAVVHSRIQSGNVAGVDELLESCAPSSRNWEWRYLRRLGHDDLRSFQGHDDTISSIAMHRSGTQLAAGGEPDGTVKVWDPATGRLLYKLEGHPQGGSSFVAFSPDGSQLATGSTADKTVRLWKAVTGEQRHVLSGHTDGVTCIAFAPGNRLVASESWDQTVKIWDAQTGERLHDLLGRQGGSAEESGILGVTFSTDGAFLAAASRDHTVKIYEVATGSVLHTLREHSDGVHTVAFSADGKYLATGSYDQAIRIWDWKLGQPLQTLTGHTGRVLGVVFSPDSKMLASGASDQTVRLWDVEKGTEIRCLRGHKSDIWSIVFHPNGHEIYSAGTEKLIRVWDARRDSEFSTTRDHDGPVYDVAFSPDGSRFASAGAHGEVRIWTMDPPTCREHHCHNLAVRALAFSSDGRWLVTGGADRKVKVWNVADWSEVSCHHGHTGEVRGVAVSPAGYRVASMSLFDGIHLWDRSTGRTIRKLKGDGHWDADVAFSPDGHLLATVDKSAVMIWDAATGQAKHKLPHNWVWNIAFSPDGQTIATGGGDMYAVRLWDVATGQLLRTLMGHSSAVLDTSFSPDGTRLATASEDEYVKLWDVASGQYVLTLRGHDREVRAIQFSPDGQWLVSAGGDGRILLWDARPRSGETP